MEEKLKETIENQRGEIKRKGLVKKEKEREGN